MQVEAPKTIQKTYNQDEAFEASLEYFNGDDLAARVWINKYALKDSEGNLYEKTPDDMHWRIAKEIARIEQKYPNPLSEKQVYDYIKGFKHIVPQGSPMGRLGSHGALSGPPCAPIGPILGPPWTLVRPA